MASLLLVLIYVCFISLGLPDSLLGSAWPVLHGEINVPVSYAGIISMTIFIGTILSSLLAERLLCRFGAGRVVFVSVAMTATALFGFSVSDSFLSLLLFSVPYGLGAGGVDAILNNYVAIHYKAQHMSWLHCMWGVGASISPYVMSFALVRLEDWSCGYLIVSVIQMTLSAFLLFSLPAWRINEKNGEGKENKAKPRPMSFSEIFSIKGAVACFLLFFFYCSFELSTSLWASSYLVFKWGMSAESAAGFASMFYIGITLGRFINGFLAMRFSDRTLIRMGLVIICVGVGLLMIPLHVSFALCGFVVIGLGCAPIYPCIIHMTPSVFGEEKSGAMIGIQMAFAYTGFMIMPSVFGILSERLTIAFLPVYISALLFAMMILHELVIKKTATNSLDKNNKI